MAAPSDTRRLLTFTLVLLVAMIDKADVALLPAVYLEVCSEFHAGPALLGLITALRGVVQALVCVVAGPLGSRYNRIHLVAAGCTFWGLTAGLIGASGSLMVLLLARAANGIGIGIVVPLLQSLVADLAPARLHGRAFGLLSFTSMLGGMLGGLLATTLAAWTTGIVEGWRLVFYMIAVVSCAMAALLVCLAREPRLQAHSVPLSARAVASEACAVLRVRSFLIILLQGGVGTARNHARRLEPSRPH